MNTRVALSACWTAALILAFALAAPAHHSFAGQFDPNSSMEIEGELIEVRWANPHAHLRVRTLEKGREVIWTIETAGASQMVRSGVLREYLVVGDKVRVAGWPPVTAAREMHATNPLTSSGRELLLFPRRDGKVRQAADRQLRLCPAAGRRSVQAGPRTVPRLELHRSQSISVARGHQYGLQPQHLSHDGPGPQVRRRV
jgi:hypothetical protein